jgi:hypothetical protein
VLVPELDWPLELEEVVPLDPELELDELVSGGKGGVGSHATLSTSNPSIATAKKRIAV